MTQRAPVQASPAEWAIVTRLLREHVPGVPVWAFGSRARGLAKPYSDLDLALIVERPLPLAQRAALAEGFSASDLPWKVDLVEWAEASPAFRALIERDHVVVAP